MRAPRRATSHLGPQTQGENPTSASAYRRLAFAPERRLVLDTLRLGHRKPMMHGFLEIDVTQAREHLRTHKAATGDSLSFTAFVLHGLGRAVAAHPEVHALQDWLGRVVLFEDVDATTIVEVEVEGRRFPLAHVVRAIQRRSVREIHDELREVQCRGMDTLPAGLRLGAKFMLCLPGVCRRLVYRALLCSPARAKRHTGTLLVTAVGMFGQGTVGWGQSAPGIHNLSVVVGGIAERPPLFAGDPGPREVLCLTVSANHELVDGGPLARFTSDLSERLQRADGLPITLPVTADH